jgi:hypothetical protein
LCFSVLFFFFRRHVIDSITTLVCLSSLEHVSLLCTLLSLLL